MHGRQKDIDGNHVGTPGTTAALALNAAQVWNYLQTYSSTVSKFPQETIASLESSLNKAATKYKDALQQDGGYDSIAYREACGLFKYFLSQAIDLGKQAWTRFDTVGMVFGISMLLVALLLGFPLNSIKKWFEANTKPRGSFVSGNEQLNNKYQMTQVAVVTIFMIFHCIVLTFSNSYIMNEESITMFILAVLCTVPSIYRFVTQLSVRGEEKSATFNSSTCLLMLIAISSRAHGLIVSGHGSDAMIRLHAAHSPGIFLPCLLILSVARIQFTRSKMPLEKLVNVHLLMDFIAISCLSISWWEKRIEDEMRNGYLSSRMSLFICTSGLFMLFYGICADNISRWRKQKCDIRNTLSHEKHRDITHTVFLILWKLLIFIVTVTGPSSSASSMLILPQAWALYNITAVCGTEKVSFFM